jgi:hypothetical protein
MTRHLGVGAALLAALLVPATVRAQLPTLQPGLRVRVDARPALDRRIVGTLMSQTTDTVTLAASATSWHRVPVADVARLDVHMGPSRWRGVARGLVIGTAIIGGGAMVGSWMATDNDFVFPIAATGAGIGALTGFFIGADKWRRVFSRERVARRGARRD